MLTRGRVAPRANSGGSTNIEGSIDVLGGCDIGGACERREEVSWRVTDGDLPAVPLLNAIAEAREMQPVSTDDVKVGCDWGFPYVLCAGD